ncbi:MAG: hypothetical protein ACE5OQ_11515 [Woeseia sp.]
MQHLVGWFQDVDQGAAAADIDVIPDETLFAQGDIIRVPEAMNLLQGVAMVSAATTFTSAQLQAPSLRTLTDFDILPVARTATFPNPPSLAWLGNNPMSLIPNESLTFNTNTDHAAAIEIYGFVWLADTPPAAVNGEIFSVRATAAITLVDGAWTNGDLTFTQDLPFGDYDVVGFRAESANLIAARLVFPGGRWRPGVPGANDPADVDAPQFRYGMSGVLGSFNSNSPPSVDMIGVTDTAETVILDLIKTG